MASPGCCLWEHFPKERKHRGSGASRHLRVGRVQPRRAARLPRLREPPPSPGMVPAEDIVKLKDVFLCIDCDEVFTAEGSRCNPRCPTCASSVLMPVSVFLQTLTAPERGTDGTREGVPGRRRKIEIVHPTPIAA